MKFRAHESFYIRKGWLYKGLKNVSEDPNIFLEKGNKRANEVLGIGTNMVKSLRYWMQATGLTVEEAKSNNRSQNITPFGSLVLKYDNYFEEDGTWWFIHYKLASNKSLATTWYWFFNEFHMREFTKEIFVESLSSYIKYNDDQATKVAISSIEGDYSCLLNTYINKSKLKQEKVLPEDNFDCPLGQLGLINYSDTNKKIIHKINVQKNTINAMIIMAAIADQHNKNFENGVNEVKISTLLNDPMNIGPIFNLDLNTLNIYLDKLQEMGHIKVIRTAGLDLVRILNTHTAEDYLEVYFKDINKSN